MIGKPDSGQNRTRSRASNKQRYGAVMGNREAVLGTLGIAVGGHQATLGSYEAAWETNFSAYSDYTPVTVRSHTTRTDHAGVERNKPRD